MVEGISREIRSARPDASDRFIAEDNNKLKKYVCYSDEHATGRAANVGLKHLFWPVAYPAEVCNFSACNSPPIRPFKAP